MRWKKRKTQEETPPAPAPVSGPAGKTRSPLERAVAAREEHAALADRLAGVDVAHLQTADTDPALLAHADTERQRVHALELTRRREVRELEVNRDYDRLRREVDTEATWARAREERTRRHVQRGIADADHAAKDVAAIEGALDETRPATAATKLARLQEKVVAGFLLFGGAGSVLSAVGIAHAIEGGTSAAWAGAIAAAAIVEVPSTTLASFVIWSQGLLQRLNRADVAIQEEDGTTVRVDPMASLPGWARTLAKRVVIGLLAFSVLVNVWGALWVGVGLWGVLGAVGAVIASASALLGWAYSLQSSAVISANMASPGVVDALAERRRVASGADIPWQQPDDGGRQEHVEAAAPVGERGLSTVLEALLAHEDTRRRVVDVIADMETAISPLPNDVSELISEPAPADPAIEDGSARSDLRELTGGDNGDDDGSAESDLRKQPEKPSEEDTDGSAESDQAKREDDVPTAPATRAVAEAVDQRRADALVLWEQGWCAPEIAYQMGRDKRTIRGYLRDQGVTAEQMYQRIRDRVAAYIEHKGPDVETRAMARDLHMSRPEAKAARERLAADGHQVYAPEQ
ncbi:hypothetical protein KIK06_29120 [Nocardiopsis sp. EMB25]|uniref:hypothetical protein n=1 Tax=Nocardiopsis sp. EMB25 TaxID=2835867 RepID=UPI0022837B8C|nr:hypothetical protein [Nocardiopsis sp. EMB25]MCY9787946.1 hypothetical protein [Nocardiopsis sp. EMB25]